MLTPAAKPTAAYAPGSTGAAYTHVGSTMMMRYFSSGMMHARYPYSSPLEKMGGLQYGEGSTEFILKGVDGFGHYDTCDLCYGVFLGDKYFVRPILGHF